MADSITALAAAALAVGISTLGISAYTEATQVGEELGGLSRATIQKAYGISDLVYNCVEDSLESQGNLNVDSLYNIISDDIANYNTNGDTAVTKSIKACIYLDPFGWHGTENEWAIELLNTEDWD